MARNIEIKAKLYDLHLIVSNVEQIAVSFT